MIAINDLLDFIRFRICFSASLSAMIGYLLFNPLDINLIFVFLASFFVFGAIYSYNNITDKKEDLVNRKRINPFVDNKGLWITIGCFFFGAIFSSFLPTISILFYITLTITGIIYSFFRIKRFFLIKNLYTSLGATQVFLLGAANLTIDAISSYFLISALIFIGSLISDLRDYVGDKAANIKTMPVRFGYDVTKKIIYLLLILFSIFVIKTNLYDLFILLPFALLMLFFLIIA